MAMRDPSDSSGFVPLSGFCPHALQEIRYFTSYNFVGERIDGYRAPLVLMTREAAEALLCISNRLRARGLLIRVFDVYRPQRAVDHFARWAADPNDIRMKPFFYPEVRKDRLFDLGFIARRSGHSRGSAVDLTLFSMRDGRDLNMGGHFDLFSPRSRFEPPEGTITGAQQENRALLRSAIEAGGFIPLKEEWWHFTLADEPFPDTYFDFPVAFAAAGMPGSKSTDFFPERGREAQKVQAHSSSMGKESYG